MTLHAFLFWVIALSTGLCAIATVATQNIVRSATWLLFTLAGTSGIFFLLGADLVGAIQLLVYVGGTLVLVVFGVMLTAQGPFITMKTSGAEWAVSTVVGVMLMGVLALTALSIRNTGPEKYTLSDEYRLGPVLPKDPKTPPGRNPAKHPLVEFAPKGRLVEQTPERLGVIQSYEEQIQNEPDAEKKEELAQERDRELRKLVNQEGATSPYSNLIGQGLMGRPVGPAHYDTVGSKKTVTRTHYLFPFEIVSVHLLVVLIGAAYLARAKRRRTQSPLAAGGPESASQPGRAPHGERPA